MKSLDDLLDFSSDIGEEDDDVANNGAETLKSGPSTFLSSHVDKKSDIVEEEELEWISNKDAFPKFESFIDIIPDNHNSNQSPISVLDHTIMTNTTNFKVPVRARTKSRKRRMDEWKYHCLAPKKKKKINKRSKPMVSCSNSTLARKCQHCQSEETPQWRAGPMGPKTLCNACGVRYQTGRLVPEYRPLNSPTFSTELHSNYHRKVMELRKQNHIDS